MSTLGTLLRQRLRRDRLQLILWIIGIGVLAYGSIAAVLDTYGDEAERTQILQVATASRTILVFRGTPNGTDLGAFSFFELFAWLALMGGLMSTFLVTRHTRAEEEQGRAELIAATPAGRVKPTVATLVHGVLANLVLGLVVALALIGAGLDAEGSWVTGAAMASVGIAFVAIGLFCAQLFRTSRGANGAGVAVVVGAYLLRGIGDAAGTPSDDLLHVTPAWPSWLSPIGWGQATGAYVENDLWPLLLALGVSAVLVVIVFALQAVRDQGASLLPGRKGRASASWALSSSFGLAWRLNLSTLIAWAVGAAVAGLTASSLSGLIDQLSGDAPQVVDTLQHALGGGATLEQAFIAMFFSIIGILAACCAVQVAIRARQEEAHGTAEQVLATPVPRMRWLLEYWLVGVLVIVVVLAAAWLGGLAGSGASNTPSDLVPLISQAALAQLPVSLVFLGITLLVFALLPRWTIGLGWSIVGVAAIIGVFGPLLGAPDWMVDLSPFTHSPVPTGDDIDWSGGFWMIAVGLAAGALAVVSMRRRELASGA
ncbi:ABC transporter permease subunit [Agromyces endophyticus]|uniref:ABC transporter permease n=1 Tax=Agromyces sp. H17E-10 TaxID=2932244 RepID=UPI001FD3864B|nr:ABC transporter permease subunit [Agromyces sp. H17E-10]UOQ90646.1 ABC transporter permease subunit [Agromyces sp. H17E-10]